MKNNNEHDVLIVGAGPTGLMLAYALAKQGISIRIIDKAQEPSKYSKALAIQARTLELFRLYKIDKDFLEKGLQADHLNAHLEKKPLFRFHIHNQKTPYPFILILPQNETEAILIERLKNDFNITVERGLDLIDIKNQARTVRAEIQNLIKNESEKATYTYVCACDGAHSTVRHLINLPFNGNIYEESFTLLDAHIKGNILPNEANAYLGRDDLIGVIPINKKYHRIILAQPAYLRPPENIEEMEALLNQHTSTSLELSDPQWMSHFRVSRRIVPTMNLENIFLLGDAAHIHSPAGGQGINLGIQDAINLAWKMAAVLKEKASENLLQSYSQERRPIALKILRGTNIATQEIITRNPLFIWIRNNIISQLMKCSWIQRRIAVSIMQIGHNYRKSLWVHGRRDGKLKPGDRFPHFWLNGVDGGEVSSLDLLDSQRHALIVVQPGKMTEKDGAFLKKISEKFSLKVSVLSPDSNLSLEPSEILEHLHISEPRYFLVRPDGYIGYIGTIPSEGEISDYLHLDDEVLTKKSNLVTN